MSPAFPRRILALGGGGFTMEPNNPLLDDFLLTLAPRHEPNLLFLPTASGDQNSQINAFYDRFGSAGCVPRHLSLFRLADLHGTLEQLVLSQDIVYVGGGSMRNLLAIWHAHGLDVLLQRAWRNGTVLAGLSAGAMCWFAGGVSRSSGVPQPMAGLGLLSGSLSVHADGEPDRLPVWLTAVADGTLPGGWAVDDGVGLLFEGRQLEKVVSSREGAGAQRIDAVAGELVRKRLEPTLLGSERRGSLAVADRDIEELREVMRLRRHRASRTRPGVGGSGP